MWSTFFIKNCKPHFGNQLRLVIVFDVATKIYEMILFYLYNFLSLRKNKHETKNIEVVI